MMLPRAFATPTASAGASTGRVAAPKEASTLTRSYFEEMMQKYGCIGKGSLVFGVTHGRPFTGQLYQPQSLEMLFTFVADGSVKPALAALRRQKLPNLRWFAEQDPAGGVLVALYTPQSDFYAKAGIHTLLSAATTALDDAGLGVPESCPFCSLGQCDSYAYLEEAYRPVHGACLQSRLDLPNEDTHLPATVRGRVLNGFAGAFLGALIAALPIFAYAMSSGRIYWALYAFIPLLSGLVYRLFRGKANSNLASLTVLASSLLMAFSLELVWNWLVLTNTYNLAIPFIDSVQEYFRSHTFFTSLREMLFCLLALTVGFVAITVFLRRYEAEGYEPAKVIRGGAYVRGSAMPIPSSKEQEPPSKGKAPAAQPAPPSAP